MALKQQDKEILILKLSPRKKEIVQSQLLLIKSTVKQIYFNLSIDAVLRSTSANPTHFINFERDEDLSKIVLVLMHKNEGFNSDCLDLLYRSTKYFGIVSSPNEPIVLEKEREHFTVLY